VKSIHVTCLWMCVLFYFSFVCLHVCAYASKFKVHCGSAFEPGASGLPYYCTPPVYVPVVLGALAVWWHNQQKKKSLTLWPRQYFTSKQNSRVQRSIAGVPFDSVRCFRAFLLLYTTFDRSWCNWSASCVAEKTLKKSYGPESSFSPIGGL